MNNDHHLQSKIMRRVYVIYALRQVKKPAVIKIALLVLCIILLGSMVSLPHIIANAPHNLSSLSAFFLAAFVNTNHIVQILTIILLLTFGLLLKDTPAFLKPLTTLSR